MIIEGTIDDIIYRNESNCYTVAKLSHYGESSIIVGKFLRISMGENVKLEGSFVTNKKYGEQFSFTTYEVVYPTTEIGIRKYLGSGLIRGVGPITAKAIVDKFREKTLDIIEFSPEKLEDIKGVSKKKAEFIGQSFKELKNVQNTIVFLADYNVSVNMALRIFEVYGAETIEKVKENPYSLVEDVDGIGFSTADKIAYNMGVNLNSQFRVRAGILHCLNEAAEKNGHTYLPKDNLFKALEKLLDLSSDVNLSLFEDVLQNLIFDKIVTVVNNLPAIYIMLTKFFFLEKGVADKLALLNQSSKSSDLDVTSEINLFEQVHNIKLHQDQKTAIANGVNKGVSIITGGPGTGKTTIIKCILEILENLGRKCLLIAPTGRASKRLSETTNHDAKTIHRALALDFKTKNFAFNEQNPLPYNAVICDETSMVDIQLMHYLLKALPRDCKLILVGDKDQLPSVGAGNVLGDILESKVISTSYLTQIYRQEENSLIIDNAHKINSGEMPEIDNRSQDFFFETKTELNEIKNTIVEMVTTRIPKFLGIETPKIQVLAPLKMGICGIESLNKELQEKINPPSLYKHEFIVGSNTFRVGDKIMQTSNNYDIEWEKNGEIGIGVFNGDIGYIHRIDIQNGEVEIWFEDGRECMYPRNELSQLSLAYAITIHKSQGCEFDVVIIPCIAGPSMILNRNLIYTAVTRAKKMVVLVGEKKNLKHMITNTFVLKRYTLLSKFLLQANKKAEELFG